MDVERVTRQAHSKWGISPPRKSLGEVGVRHARQWRMLPTDLVRIGDTIAYMGLVQAVEECRADDVVVQIHWMTGIDWTKSVIKPGAMVKVFTEVDMRYAKIGGKGKIHIARESRDVNGVGATLCGKEGDLVMIADENAQNVCAGCRRKAM